MKLLNASNAAVATLDEGTTRLVYYGTDPALIYFEATKTAKTCTVKKVSGLDGFTIETDAGNKVKLSGTVAEMVAALETLLGTKIGYVDPNATFPMPSKTVEFYKEKDADDKDTITITVNVDGEDPIVVTFTRGPNAPKVKDLLAKLPTYEGKTVKGVSADGTTILGKKDKLLEDQTLTLIFEAEETTTPAITLTADANTVAVGSTVNVTSDVEGVTWSSSDEEKATVADGVVTGVAEGEVTITAAKDGYTSGTVTVTVTAVA